jgi:hypothetical protein
MYRTVYSALFVDKGWGPEYPDTISTEIPVRSLGVREMAERPEQNIQVSVGMSADLHERLEAAARQSVRSLTGEIRWRLQNSLGHAEPEQPRKRGWRKGRRRKVVLNPRTPETAT